MYDRKWLQSDLSNDRTLHKVCRGRALLKCLSRRDLRSLDQYLDSRWHSSRNMELLLCENLLRRAMRRSQVAQAHSMTYNPQNNGIVERQKRTLVSRMKVYCSRYITGWDRFLPQVMVAYNSRQHSTTE